MNPRKNDETWFPRKNFSQCIPDIAETCDNIPESKDLTFFLLNNEFIGGVDGYSDDDDLELQAMFSGGLRISNIFQFFMKFNSMNIFREYSNSKFL